MVKVCVLQSDNRPSLNYLVETQKMNKIFCDMLGYEYVFLELDNNKYGTIHPATKKIHIINDFLLHTNCDILVFLDSDAWIQNGYWLKNIIHSLQKNDEKHGCFSRDPYLKKNTFINSGSFIIKNNDFTKQMYDILLKDLYTDHSCHNNWPYDQYYISKYIFENKEKFTIFIPDILNTPMGRVLRHNWWKNQKMYDDLTILYRNLTIDPDFCNVSFIEKDYYDDKVFPNESEVGYEYVT